MGRTKNHQQFRIQTIFPKHRVYDDIMTYAVSNGFELCGQHNIILNTLALYNRSLNLETPSCISAFTIFHNNHPVGEIDHKVTEDICQQFFIHKFVHWASPFVENFHKNSKVAGIGHISCIRHCHCLNFLGKWTEMPILSFSIKWQINHIPLRQKVWSPDHIMWVIISRKTPVLFTVPCDRIEWLLSVHLNLVHYGVLERVGGVGPICTL